MRARWAQGVGGAAVLLASMLVSPCARADEGGRAEQLFQEARVLVDAQRYAEACPKLEESLRLDPAVGTQFNLADCYERVGKTASAFTLFRDVAGIARAAGKFERERSAKERMTALEPRLARIEVTFGARAPGLTVALDGTPRRDLEETTAPLPVDPGAHTLRASAPGHAPHETTFDAREAALTTVVVPALTSLHREPSPAESAPEKMPVTRKIAIGLGGAAVLGAAVGGVAGALALSNRASAQRLCPEDAFAFRCPTEDGARAWNEARSAGTISTVGFVAGGVLLAGAAVLWFASPSPRVRAGVASTGLRLEGSF